MAETQIKEPTIKKKQMTIKRAISLSLSPKDLIPQFDGVAISISWGKMIKLCNEYVLESEHHLTEESTAKGAITLYMRVMDEGDLF